MSAPVARTLSGSIAFTVPAVPTGMKAGVRTSPRGVRITPVRAFPSVALTVNSNFAPMPAARASHHAPGYTTDPVKEQPNAHWTLPAQILISSLN